jgi:outer membrane protein OmpA-like peptidoglycan-associated protein
MKNAINRFYASFLLILIVFLAGCLRKKDNICKDNKIKTCKTEKNTDENCTLENNIIETYSDDIENADGESIFENEKENEQYYSNYEPEDSENKDIVIQHRESSIFYQDDEKSNESYKSETTVTSFKKIIGTILFDFDVYENIRSDQESDLNILVAKINNLYEENNNLKIVIKGHACNSEGTEKYNLQLSDKRAQTIRSLIKKNTKLKDENISSFGCGTSELLTTGNREKQAINRRAEVYID